MARPRSKIELTLFPFLSVLCGLIAVLILHIFVVLETSRAEARKAPRSPEARQTTELAKQKQDLTREIQAIQNQLGVLDDEREQLLRVLELRRRQDRIDAAGTGSTGEPIGAPVPKQYRIVPIARGQGDLLKSPVLVEVRADQYIVSGPEPGQQTSYPTIEFDPKSERLKSIDPNLQAFLATINHQRRDKYLLFLIQPDGIDAFTNIKKYCDKLFTTRDGEEERRVASPMDYFDYGFEPFSTDWVLLGPA
ncbi:hypothetical protein BH23PLA1_BH23PLA1_34110 [soil metagenome]